MENEAKVDNIYFHEDFVNDYVEKYAPEYVNQLKTKQNLNFKISESSKGIKTIGTNTIYVSSAAKNPYGDVIAYVTCTIKWNWDTATGKITYLAPDTTTFWNPNWTELYKWRANSQELSADETSGHIAKIAEFRGYWDVICSISGNVYYGGSDDITEWHSASPSN